MTNFLARVEIHDGEPEDYIRLYSCLKEIGYVDTYTFDKYKSKLPTGTYAYQRGVLSSSVMATYDELTAQTDLIFKAAVKANPGKKKPFVVVAPFYLLCTKHLPHV